MPALSSADGVALGGPFDGTRVVIFSAPAAVADPNPSGMLGPYPRQHDERRKHDPMWLQTFTRPGKPDRLTSSIRARATAR